eukprot:3109447-Rhodomonas_salina.1
MGLFKSEICHRAKKVLHCRAGGVRLDECARCSTGVPHRVIGSAGLAFQVSSRDSRHLCGKGMGGGGVGVGCGGGVVTG